MNPPFGTKKTTEGLDIKFLNRAMSMTTGPIYSIHKSSTRKVKTFMTNLSNFKSILKSMYKNTAEK